MGAAFGGGDFCGDVGDEGVGQNPVDGVGGRDDEIALSELGNDAGGVHEVIIT